jgi:small ligand-binding sensory domain FIST
MAGRAGVSVVIGAGLSTHRDPLEAGVEASTAAARGLDGAAADLVVVFASGAHLGGLDAMLSGVHGTLRPRALVGCGAGGVLGGGRELESGTAIAVWAAAFGDGGTATPFHCTAPDTGADGFDGLPELDAATGMIMLADPYTFPTEVALAEVAERAPTVPVLGGLSSARSPDGEAALFYGREVCDGGAVGVAFTGIEMFPCVSQGAAPIGREMTITGAEGNLIRELAGRPALKTIEQIVADCSPRERALVAQGVLIGIVVDSGQPEYEQGDFLVRGVLGADPESGAVAVGATVREGQIVRLHARDARSADEDLCHALQLHRTAMSGRPPAGALVFSCNGRGRAMFGAADHDAATVQRELGGAPAAGFFAAGEIGPIGGRSFLHGFTATVAVFPADTLPAR